MTVMRRGFAALVMLAVTATMTSACASGVGGETTIPGVSTTIGDPDIASSLPGDATSTSVPPEETTTTSNREVAPDFTLDLGDGGEYTLSEGEKPVYLVFWAEW